MTSLDFNEIKSLIQRQGLTSAVNDHKVRQLITQFDLDGDGVLDEAEFVQAMECLKPGGTSLHYLSSVSSSNVSDDVQLWSELDTANASDALLSGSWHDQGWGAQKGMLYAKGVSGDWEALFQEPAPQSEASFEVNVPSSLLGGRLQLGYRVGGGGGHALTIMGPQIEVRGTGEGGGSGMGDVTSLKFTIAEGMDKEFEHLLSQPYGNGQYRDEFVKMRASSKMLVAKLIEEFASLLQLNDVESVRKATALKYICKSVLSAKDVVDFEKLRDCVSYLDETVLNAMRIFGEEKHNVLPLSSDNELGNFRSGSLMDNELVTAILSCKDKHAAKDEMMSRAAKGKRNRYNEVYNLFVLELMRDSGVTPGLEFTGMVYKPIQSLFNKMYVRRGQFGMNIIGDLQRGSVYVKTPEELDTVRQSLGKRCAGNLKKEIESTGDLALMLDKIKACEPMALTNEQGDRFNVFVYRVKDNSSQKERTDRGELSHAINVNFFIDGPQADLSRSSVVIGACELQVGVLSTLQAMRSNHQPYERQRILDGIPQLAFKLNKAIFSPSADYAKMNKLLGEYHVVKTICSITLTHKDGMSRATEANEDTYRDGCEPTLYCLNHGRVNAWAILGRSGFHTMLIWECDINPHNRYMVEQLSVNIADQGWGNIGVNIAFFAIVSDYMMEVASRSLEVGERSLKSLDLVKDNFNFSRFMFSSYLPNGTRKVALVAMGRLNDFGHEFRYWGHSLQLGVLA